MTPLRGTARPTTPRLSWAGADPGESGRAGPRRVAEGHAQAGCGAALLGHGVLPAPLGQAPGDEKVPAAQVEGPRRAASVRPEAERSRGAERDEGDDGPLDRGGDAVAVPGHAVAAVPIEVEADGIELDRVALGQDATRRLELGRQLDALARPARREPRLHDPPPVHHAVVPGPWEADDQLGEELVRARE